MTHPDWVPFTLAWDDQVPVDISFVFDQEKPAGKHGFLKTDGERFAFEDGTEGRFWGTCFNSGACFPTHEQSEMVARRLAKFGVNVVRMHQMDGEWATPNIFAFNKAEPQNDTRSLDPRSMDRLDYLIHCLKQQGIYTYLDMLTYRQFRPGDAVDAVDQLGQAAKPYDYFDPRLVELQKEFNAQLWNHVNPYTRLAYKDDPAIAFTEVVNESDPFSSKVRIEPYRSRLETQYRAWAQKLNLRVDEEAVDFAKPTAQVGRFLHTVMVDHYRDIIAHLRSIGVKVPVNGTNWIINMAVTAAQDATDFCDSHAYWNFPLWESEQGTGTAPMVGDPSNCFSAVAFCRIAGRPFTVSEWDHPWPDEWRAESPLAYAAAAALQGWGAMIIHTYRYNSWGPVDCLGGGASTINGITYRKHFDSFNDPAKFGLFHHGALLLRRGDVRKAEKSVAVTVETGDDWYLKGFGDVPALIPLAEMHRVGMAIPGTPPKADIVVAHDTPLLDVKTCDEVKSDTGEMWRSWKKRCATIDTPLTKAAYGFLGGKGLIALQGLGLEVTTDFAVIALSSLTDQPIAQSASLLLTAVGRCDNTGAQYDARHSRQLDFGHAPVLIEPIRAKLILTTNLHNLKVWVISDKGEAVTRLKTEYKDGVLSFEIGPQPRWSPSTMYYLLRV